LRKLGKLAWELGITIILLANAQKVYAKKVPNFFLIIQNFQLNRPKNLALTWWQCTDSVLTSSSTLYAPVKVILEQLHGDVNMQFLKKN